MSSRSHSLYAFSHAASPEAAVPRRYIWVAAGMAATFGVMALRRYVDGKRKQAEEDETSGPVRERARDEAPRAERAPRAAPRAERAAEREALGGGASELSEFLAGDSWFDENGWSGIWEREGIADPAAWLRERGAEVLRREREKLKDHPALLAGCRRRWIVVCRYAGIDVGEAAALWNETDGGG